MSIKQMDHLTYHKTLSSNIQDNAIVLITYNSLFQAYKIGLYGPKYVWMLPGWYHNNWPDAAPQKTSCTAEQVMEAANGMHIQFNSFIAL